MEKTSLSQQAARARLVKYTDPEKIFYTKKACEKEVKIKEEIRGRMFFDPLGHWKLLNRCV